ncbi:MAG TPA: single-stranded-DNA-specific exonuclease RecJ [Porphyromonadaceae bacterium]|nr:single-stranded-DNA-specific exonuclease RecJ [Porphyromonadaceae bacterium]
MDYIWNTFELDDKGKESVEVLQNELGISPLLCRLLVRRGIVNLGTAKKFFRPQLTDLHDPFLMNDMDKAVKRLNEACMKGEKVLIYGDYDVDGITSVSLVYRFLSQFLSNIGYYLPDRYEEGYGISLKGVDYAIEKGYTLIIALDCGIKDHDKVEYANSHGIDVIICDHHTPNKELPKAVAVLNPKREDNTYPYEHLSGCGVGFKFMQAWVQDNGMESSVLFPSLALLTISIASDIVPVTGENRVLSYYGLQQLNNNPSVGIKGLISLCGLEGKEVSMLDVAFKMGPRINASGRIQSAREAVKMLITNDLNLAREQMHLIEECNSIRRSLDRSITEEAIQILSAETGFENSHAIVIGKEGWHKGVMGIVAARMVELYYKPSIVLSLSDGVLCGSARSVDGFDIYSAISSCSDLLLSFGGHTYAAGLSLEEKNLQAFKERFSKYVEEHITAEQLVPKIKVEAEIKFDDITAKFYRILKQFGPFGVENENPIFVTRGVYDYGGSRLVGKNQEHLKLELVDGDSHVIIGGIAFGMSRYYKHLKAKQPIDICYTLEENVFNGETTLQLLIKDIKV